MKLQTVLLLLVSLAVCGFSYYSPRLLYKCPLPLLKDPSGVLDAFPEAIERYPLLMDWHPEEEGKFPHLQQEYERRQAMGSGVIIFDYKRKKIILPGSPVDYSSLYGTGQRENNACDKSISFAANLCRKVDDLAKLKEEDLLEFCQQILGQ